MNITFLGGADEVGASCILIEIAGRRLLVDAGIRPTPRARWGLAGDHLPDLSLIDNQGGIDAILVTHAHTDHTGALELVLERYPDVPVYATPVTVELTRVLHQDARRIMKMRLEEEGELPLYDEVATTRLLAAFQPVAFNQTITLAPGLTATYFLAGHIAGAAMIGLASAEGRILISGDISISPQRTVDGARPPAFSPDVLILESTYGGRLHANRHAEELRLVETVAEITGAGGKVLIPAFALGRAQEVLLTLGEFQRRGELPPLPIWADGMVRAICQAYGNFPEALPLALQEQGATFYTEQIRPVTSARERSALIWEPGPAVIVASSGMLAGGPSLAYARALAGQPQNAILLTGYQDEEAPGRRLQEIAQRGHGTLRLGKDRIDVQCRLGTYSLSAHADTGQLVSFVETLDPNQVFLVHGDGDARHNLAGALQARGRNVRLPRAGQSFAFNYTPLVRPQSTQGMGQGRPLDLRRLWQILQPGMGTDPTASAGGLVTVAELARIWWGERPGSGRMAELTATLAQEDRHFSPDPVRTGVFRVRSRAQVELITQRQNQMSDYGDLGGRWLLARDPEGEVRLGLVLQTAKDHVQVRAQSPDGAPTGGPEAEELPFIVWPEDILSVFHDALEGEQALSSMATVLAGQADPAGMEPNQALAVAQDAFPPAARLRRTGYRLTDHTLTLTFDFPDAAQLAYAEVLDGLAVRTGWQVEVTPEANQSALTTLVSECLPAGYSIHKGPSIYRIERRVVVSVAPPESQPDETTGAQLIAAAQIYETISGYNLEINQIQPPSQPTEIPVAGSSGEPMEINAAYALIRQTLAGSTLYRTSLKAEEIVLAFISPQVGARFQDELEQLAAQVGWPLVIHPQPNQAAILQTAREVLRAGGLAVVKGPSIYLDRGEVGVTLASPPEEESLTEIEVDFASQTGYRLRVTAPGMTIAAVGRKAPVAPPVEIALDQVRLSRSQQGLTLNPTKLENAIQRARREGQNPAPIQVRRLQDAYLLVDGLYRLRAAQSLGWSRIWAVVE